MVLKPNEVAIYNKVEQKLTRQGDWRMPEMKFHGATGSSYSMICRCRRLPANFPTHSDTTIHIADSTLQNYRITARFRNGEDLDAILSVLHNAGYFNYSRNTQQITITTKLDLK